MLGGITTNVATCHQAGAGSTTKPVSLCWPKKECIYWAACRVALCQQHDKLCLLTLQESLGKNLLIRAVIMASMCVCVCACLTLTQVVQGPDYDRFRALPCLQLYIYVCMYVGMYVCTYVCGGVCCIYGITGEKDLW